MAVGGRRYITELLKAWEAGDRAALSALAPLVEDEVHRIAQHYLGLERPDHTLQPTDLVNEVYVRLIEQGAAEFEIGR